MISLAQATVEKIVIHKINVVTNEEEEGTTKKECFQIRVINIKTAFWNRKYIGVLKTICVGVKYLIAIKVKNLLKKNVTIPNKIITNSFNISIFLRVFL